MKVSGLTLTPNQEKVLRYLELKSDATGLVKLSSYKLAREFGWTDNYAARVLQMLTAKDAIVLIKQGDGSRANKFRVQRIDWPSVIVKLGRRGVASRASSAATERSRLSQKTLENNKGRKRSKIALAIYPHAQVESNAHTRVGESTFSGALGRLRQVAPPKFSVPEKSRSPLVRFRSKINTPETWNVQDIVCYYAYLFRYEYKAFPQINWREDTISAKILHDKCQGDTVQAKRYLQIAFALFHQYWTISGIRSLVTQKMITWVTENWYREQLVSDYEDIDVFAN